MVVLIQKLSKTGKSPLPNEIGVYLIGNNQYVIFFAQPNHFLYFLRGPDTPGRIVRRNRDKHFNTALQLLLKVIKINRITIRFPREGGGNDFAIIQANGTLDGIIQGRCNENRIARVRKILNNLTQRIDNARTIDNPFSLRHPVIVFLNPPFGEIDMAFTHIRIAVNAMICRSNNSSRNFRGYPKIHVGDG